MKGLKGFFTIAALLIAATSFAQTGNEYQAPKLGVKKSLKQADYLFSIGSYYNAIGYYSNVVDKQEDNAYAGYQIGLAEFYLRDYKSAETWFKKVLDINSPGYPLAGYYYGMMLKYNGKYDLAKQAFTSFQKTYKGENAAGYKKLAKNHIAGCDLAVQLIANPDTVRIMHLGLEINQPYSDFSPTPWGDSLLIYSSLKSDSIIQLNDIKKNNQFAEFYAAPRTGDSTYSKSKLFMDIPVNDKDNHVGNGAFSPDHKRFYFTKCKMDNTMKTRCDIYETVYKDGKWSNPNKMGPEINSPDFTNTQPCIGTSKAGDVMYFVSDRVTGGEGGLDIWFSLRGKDGSWGEATAAGKKINTAGNEITPWYDSKGSTLYFSSDGQIGIGGYDIFKTKGSQKKWIDATNLGVPVNSSADDMYYILDDKKYTGYLVSNRSGTTSVKSETCCDDIWRVIYPRIINYAVKGYVFDAETKQPIEDAKVIMVTKDTLWGNSQMSDNDTMYFWDTKSVHNYELKADKDGYFSNSSAFFVQKKENSDTMRVDIFLKKIPIGPLVIKNIFYDFDKATLRPESYPSLDTLFQLLTDNPTIQVQIRSHTDSKGKDSYNLKLSQGRAQSVVNYLVGKGIDPSRLVATGMGETELLVKETTESGKDCEECRQQNRRTDFKIIGNIPGKEIIYQQGSTGFDPDAIDTYEEQQQEKQQEDAPLNLDQTTPK